MIKALFKAGGKVVGGKGSHTTIRMPNGTTLTIPKTLGIGLATKLLK